MKFKLASAESPTIQVEKGKGKAVHKLDSIRRDSLLKVILTRILSTF